METKHLTYFKVENFKRFDSLEVNDIGQFNLIVGDNNVGKTSLLEALLFDDENYNQWLSSIWGVLGFKKITIPNGALFDYIDFFLNNVTQPLIYQFQYGNKGAINTLKIAKKKRSLLTNEEIEKMGTYFKLNHQSQNLIEFNFNEKIDLKFTTYGEEPGTYEDYLPFISFNLNYDADILTFFSKLSISTQKLKNLENELKYFIPNLVSLEINNAIVPGTSVLAIREKNTDLRPLAQYGDGFNKLMRYLLEMEICENRRLMIDEIDTGIHYSRMKDFLKKVLQSAKNKNVQIFATTHSKECLEYYTQALEELGYQNDGRVIKIADTKSGIKSFTFNFEQFDNALFAGSEIR